MSELYFWSIKNSSDFIENLRLRNFQVSQISSFDFSILYDLFASWSYQNKSVVSGQLVFQQRVKFTSVLRLQQNFYQRKIWLVGLASYVKLLLSSWKTYNYVQFNGMVYQQIVGIPMGTNCVI